MPCDIHKKHMFGTEFHPCRRAGEKVPFVATEVDDVFTHLLCGICCRRRFQILAEFLAINVGISQTTVTLHKFRRLCEMDILSPSFGEPCDGW